MLVWCSRAADFASRSNRLVVRPSCRSGRGRTFSATRPPTRTRAAPTGPADPAIAGVAHLTEDAAAPQPFQRRQRRGARRLLHLPAVLLDPLDLDQGGEVFADVVGQVGMPVHVLLQRRSFAAAV